MSFDLKQCAVCKQLLKRKKIGQTKSGPVWADEQERKWHGKQCPDCYGEKNRNRPKKNTEEQSE